MTRPASLVLRARRPLAAADVQARLGSPVLWTEALPYAAGDPRADALRRRAASRPFAAQGAPVRVLLLTYADRVQDLVVSARPATLDEAGLTDVACLLAGDGSVEGWPQAPVSSGGEAFTLPLDWAAGTLSGTGTREVLTVRLPEDAQDIEAAVVTALSVALARRTGGALSAGPGERTGGLGLRLPTPAATVERLAAAGLRLLWRPPAPTTAPLAFSLDRDSDDSYLLSCDFRTDLVAAEAARALLAEIRDRVAGSTDEVTTPVSAQAPELKATIHDLVAARAEEQPDAVAVTENGVELTYRQLLDWAEEIATRVRARGTGPGQLVGVSLPRGTELIASLLGVLMSGAAYVPIDLSYPEDRLRYMTEDSGLTLVLAHEQRPAFAGVPHLAPPPLPADGQVRRWGKAQPAAPSDPAYAIYTSGSTGRPKGVVVEHRNFAALLAATQDEFGLGGSDVWTFFHSFAFDFSVWEIWACLATGGRLVVVPEDVARVPEEFRELLHTEGVTVLNQTPSAFVQLLSTEAPGASSLAVRLLIFGGEPLDSRLLLPWFDAHPEDRCRVVNMYGITETTVHCTWATLTRRDALAGSRSIGTPLPGWTVHVLDPYGRPLPAGVPGEIHVGGAGVARGYLGRPGLTAQRFRPDHLAGHPGARLYRSGDRGRLCHDGQLEHLGRLDGQVKVRGYRIELDEIRNRLLEAAEVRAAAVVLRHRGASADAHLDVYVVGPQADPDALRAHLERVLPGYMMPSTITRIEELPVTGNGKLDAARLPEPATQPRLREAAQDAAPDLEARISRTWQDVLGSPVTADDNFFLSGGNSLLAIRVMVRLREQGITEAPVRVLYRNPTVRELTLALAETAG